MGKERFINDSDEPVYIVDENGELLKVMKKGDMLVSGKSIEACKRRGEETMPFDPDSEYVKLFIRGIESIPDELKGSDFKAILKLCQFIDYETGILVKRGQYNKAVPLLQEDLINVTGISKKTVISTMERLVEQKVFAKVRTGRQISYLANPFIFMKGKRISKTLYNIFKTYKYK
jgi:hypothetical protein